jgi:hypothetical protein
MTGAAPIGRCRGGTWRRESHPFVSDLIPTIRNSVVRAATTPRESRPISETTRALAAYLRTGRFDLERVERFRAESFDVADGRSTQCVTDELIVPSLTRVGERR